MDFAQLEQLEAIARLGSMNAAAADLHISQPALSRSIKRLEGELGVSLFERHGRQATLNDAGKLALEHARSILRQRALMESELANQARRAQTLLVGTVAPAPLWRLVSLIVERYPQTVLASETFEPQRVAKSLLDGAIDLAIALEPHPSPAVESLQLMTENLSVSVPKSNPLSKRSSLCAHDLDGQAFLLAANIGFWQNYCDTHLPHSKFVVQQDRAVFEQMTRTTPLIYFTSDAPSLAPTPNKDRTVIPLCDDAAHATFYLLARNDARAQAKAVFNWVKQRLSS